MLTHPALDADAGAIVALAVLQAARVALAQLAATSRPALLAVAAALLAAAPVAAVKLALGSAAVVAGPLLETDTRLAFQVVHTVLRAIRQATAEPLVGIAAVGAAPTRPAPAAAFDAHSTSAALRVWTVGSLAVLAAEARLAGTAAAEAATAAGAVGPFAEVVANGALGALPAGFAAAATLYEAPVAPAEHGAHAVRAVETYVARKAVALAQSAAAVAMALTRTAGGHVPGHGGMERQRHWQRVVVDERQVPGSRLQEVDEVHLFQLQTCVGVMFAWNRSSFLTAGFINHDRSGRPDLQRTLRRCASLKHRP